MPGNQLLGGMRALLGIPETVGQLGINTFFDVGASGAQVLANPNAYIRAVAAGVLGDDTLSEQWNQQRDARRAQLPTYNATPQTEAIQQAALGGITSALQAGVEAYPGASASTPGLPFASPGQVENTIQTAGEYMANPTVQAVMSGTEALALPVSGGARRLTKAIKTDLATPTLGEELYSVLGATQAPAGGAVSTFAGRQSITNLAESGKTVRTSHGELGAKDLYANMAEAKRMADEGADADLIWTQTGFFKGADDQWRYEIDDSPARILDQTPEIAAYLDTTGGASHPAMLADVIRHPDVNAAYPSMADAKATLTADVRGGHYEQPNPAVTFGDERLQLPAKHRGGAFVSKDATMSTTLHEQQHGIQYREGMNRGANPATFNQQADAELARDAMSWRKELRRLRDKSGVTDWNDLDRMAHEEYARLDAADWVPPKAAREVAMDLENNPSEQLEALVKAYKLDERVTPLSPDEAYRTSAGEVEARNVQARRDMTAQERAETPPIATESVPRADQWVDLKGGGVPQSVATLPPRMTFDMAADIDGAPKAVQDLADEFPSSYWAPDTDDYGNVSPTGGRQKATRAANGRELYDAMLEKLGSAEAVDARLAEAGFVRRKSGPADNYLDTQASLQASNDPRATTDAASRAARAEQMGYTTDTYHGSTHNITDFDATLANPEGDWGRSVYQTTSLDDASTNYAGEGPDLTQRIGLEAERVADELMDDPDALDEYGVSRADYEADEAAVAHKIARARLTGEAEGGVMYPLKTDTSEYAVIGGRESTRIEGPDYRAQALDEGDIVRSDFEDEWDYEDALNERAYEIEADDEDGLYARVSRALDESSIAEDGHTKSAIMEQVHDSMADGVLDLEELDNAIRGNGVEAYDDTGEMVSAGGVSAEVLASLGFKGVIDKTVNRKFGSQRQYGVGMEGMDYDTSHVITFPGHENTIRSRNAMFDPKKRSSTNILASHPAAATVGGLLTATLASQPEK